MKINGILCGILMLVVSHVAFADYNGYNWPPRNYNHGHHHHHYKHHNQYSDFNHGYRVYNHYPHVPRYNVHVAPYYWNEVEPIIPYTGLNFHFHIR